MYELTRPSEVARCAFFAAAACPFLRKMLTACSTSPPPSTSASRQAVNPAPVRSRNSFTCCADTFGFPSAVAIIVLIPLYEIGSEYSGTELLEANANLQSWWVVASATTLCRRQTPG